MEIIKEEIGNYIFYIIPEENTQAFYIKNKKYGNLMYMFGIMQELNYTEEQLKDLLYKNANEYITLYQNDWED